MTKRGRCALHNLTELFQQLFPVSEKEIVALHKLQMIGFSYFPLKAQKNLRGGRFVS
jgi:hypothetical protein